MKAQGVRLVDVFFLGPLMIYAATREAMPGPLNAALLLSGILTITYNAQNYIKAAK